MVYPHKNPFTESSARIRILRSWDSMQSQNPDSSASASRSSRQIGAPDIFPLVITRNSGISIPSSYVKIRSCTGAYGSITPTFGLPGATDGQRISASFFFIQKQDRLLMSVENFGLFCANFTFFSDSFGIFCHHCKRLHRTTFELPQAADCPLI